MSDEKKLSERVRRGDFAEWRGKDIDGYPDYRLSPSRVADEIAALEQRLAEAHYFVQTYANKHPRHEHNGVIQDPAGAHDWLKWYAENTHD